MNLASVGVAVRDAERTVGERIRARPEITVESASDIETFHVFDARTSLDSRGRLTIPDREFVEQHDVRTVLGVGGAMGSELFAVFLFARQHVTRTSAEQFVPLASTLASLATDAVLGGRIFGTGERLDGVS